MLSFEHTEYLIAILFVLILGMLFLYSIQRKKRISKTIGDYYLMEQLTASFSKKKHALKNYLLLTGLILIVIAAANPRKPELVAGDKKAGVDVMVALDISKSMYSQDIKPSRLDRAKQFINFVINNLGDNRMGLVVFAGRAYTQMPLTTDLTSAKIFVANADPTAIPVQGTNIGQALQQCAQSLNTNEKKFKAIVLLTDGEDHEDEATASIIEELALQGVVIHTIGVGTAEGSFILEPGTNVSKKDIDGNTIVSKLNEPLLKDIAEKTDGMYQNISQPQNAATAITTSLNNMEKKALEGVGSARHYTSFYWLVLMAAMLMLLLEIFISEIKKPV